METPSLASLGVTVRPKGYRRWGRWGINLVVDFAGGEGLITRQDASPHLSEVSLALASEAVYRMVVNLDQGLG